MKQQPPETSKDDCWKAFLAALSEVEATGDQESADRLPSLRIGWVNPGDVPWLDFFVSRHVHIVAVMLQYRELLVFS